ncbi:hypothetical protein ACJDU8_20680 [Clostridium sp. WILCCON 0269]|uniref:FeoB-associated Cys-rich membrane protein n=1 Tax=Candidatus Clostridium eludens TaxID=3381663 RepID=A0ABW8SS38_9CLOT
MIQKITITTFIVIIVELVAYFVHKSKKDSKAKESNSMFDNCGNSCSSNCSSKLKK